MDLRRIIITALFAALMVAGAYIAIPVGPVSITLQTLFVLLAGILGGKAIGLSAVAVYLALGAMGLPVFSGGAGGFAHFASPTGGFLISWLPAVTLAGFCADRGFSHGKAGESTTRHQLLWIMLGAVLATIVVYAVGLPILKIVLELSWSQTIAVGLFPFIPGDLLKIVASVILGNLFAPRVRTFLRGKLMEAVDENHTGA